MNLPIYCYFGSRFPHAACFAKRQVQTQYAFFPALSERGRLEGDEPHQSRLLSENARRKCAMSRVHHNTTACVAGKPPSKIHSRLLPRRFSSVEYVCYTKHTQFCVRIFVDGWKMRSVRNECVCV